MSDFLFIAGLFASIAAIMWCIYHIGWGEGYERGWWDGYEQGMTNNGREPMRGIIDALRRYSHEYDNYWYDELKRTYVCSSLDPQDGVHVINGGDALRGQIDRIEKALGRIKGAKK